jgi:CubicO group peptidase (beta-lactamase class C family)
MRGWGFILLVLFTSCVDKTESTRITSEAQDTSLDSLVSAYMLREQIPGCAYAIVKNGKINAEGYLGYSNLNYRVPVSDSTLFAIASMDKQITATAIMILEEEGKLRVDEKISTYFDSLQNSWQAITIEHLLTHTSGLPDEVAKTYVDRYLIEYKSSELFDHIKSLSLDFKPGESWNYSDANFFLIQLIVEKVSGMSYEDFLKKRMFQPLEITQSRILEPYHILPHLAQSYDIDSTGKLITNIWRSVSFGPLYNDIGFTLNDFIKWEIAIQKNTLLKQSTYDRMWTPVKLNDGSLATFDRLDQKGENLQAHYGYGWELGTVDGKRNIFHGGYAGTSIQRYPDQGLTVIVFTNLCRGKFVPDDLASTIVRAYKND